MNAADGRSAHDFTKNNTVNNQQNQKTIYFNKLLKYLWAVAVSGLVIGQVRVDKENKYLPMMQRALELLQRQYPVDLIHDKSRASPILAPQPPNEAPSSSTNNAETPRQD